MSYTYPLKSQPGPKMDSSQHNLHTAVPDATEKNIIDGSLTNNSPFTASDTVFNQTAAVSIVDPTPTTTFLNNNNNKINTNTTNSTMCHSADQDIDTGTGTNTASGTDGSSRVLANSESSSTGSTPNTDSLSPAQFSADNDNNSSLLHHPSHQDLDDNHVQLQEDLARSSKSGKVGKACDQCRYRKVKCDGEKPCSRCSKTSNSCTYNYVFKMRKPMKREPTVYDDEKPKKKRGRPRKVQQSTITKSSESESVIHSTINNNITMNKNTILQPRSQSQSQSQSQYNLTDLTGRSSTNKQIPLFHNSNLNTLPTLSNIPSIPPTPFIPSNYNQNSQNQFQSQVSPLQPDIFNYQPNYIPATPSFDHNTQQIYKPSMLSNLSVTSKHVDETNIENRLQKLESMLSVLIDKVSSPSINNNFTPKNSSLSSSITPQSFPLNGTENYSTNLLLSNEGDDDDGDGDGDGSTDESYDFTKADQFNGLFTHTAIFFLSKIGLISLENKMSDPKLLSPLRKILGIVSPCEARVMSVWKNPIPETKLSPLPSREIIFYLLEKIGLCTSVLLLVDISYLKKLFKSYCDHRDGLIPEPKFTYPEYFLMNAFLLITSEIVCEMVRTKTIGDENFPGLSYFADTQEKILDNAVFYYVRVSVISGGLLAISASLLLSFYADCVSLSRAAYLISSTAIRQAQELGLHLEDTYRGLESTERNLKLNLWWTCYMIDKEMCIRWGHTAVINDSDVSAPPLPGFEAFWSSNDFESDAENVNGKEGESQSMRSKRGIEIRAALTPFLKNFNKATILEQFVFVDYALLCSKIYNRFFRANAMKNMTKKKVNYLLVDTLHELDCWRKNIPLEIQPRDGDNDYEILEFINSMKKQNSKLSLYKMYMATEFHVRYHHLRLMIHRAYIKNWVIQFSEPFKISLCKEQLVSARSILRLSFVVDGNFGNFTNYFAFYPFHAFILVCAYYVYTKKRLVEMESDFKLLIDCLKIHLKEESEFENTSERIRHINYVLKAMLYATYHTCAARFGPFDLPGIEILDDINNIKNGVKTIDEVVLLKNDLRKGNKVKPFCKMPYYENQVFPSEQPNVITKETLANSNPTRTPNVEFLLSPSHHPTVSLTYPEGMEFSKDNFFHNMLNIPNYFMDPLAED